MLTRDPEQSANPDDLLARARAGDQVALGLLLDGYRNYLVLLARLGIGRRLQGKIEPADAVQEVFLKAHRDFAVFRGTTPAELSAWLRQILTWTLANLARRYAGTRKRDVRMERVLADDLERSSRMLDRGLAARQSSPSQRAARREQAVLLADALAALPADRREVVVLRNLEGLPFGQVAARMGRSEEAVRKLWTRALKGLRRVLIEQGDGDELLQAE